MSKLPIINTHTHIFTEKNIPPMLAKSYVPWPFYLILHTGLVFRIIKFYKMVKKSLEPLWKFQTFVISFIKTTKLIRLLDRIVSLFLTFNVLVFIINWSGWSGSEFKIGKVLAAIDSSFGKYLMYQNIGNLYKVLIILLLFFLYPAIGKLLWSLCRKLFSQLQYIPTKESLNFIKRYMTIAEFAKYDSQKKIFDRLIKMYDPGSKVVVLPMDMEYMDAWQPSQSYIDQINELSHAIESKQTNTEYLIPFLFVDPRRVRDEKKNKVRKFFDWEIVDREVNGKHIKWVKLKDCFLRDCIEGTAGDGSLDGYYKGIKIYPAIGYYPFDEDLLPLWAYCVQHDLPITTHCITGTIFYRGNIEKRWMTHPIFKFKNGDTLHTKTKSNYELQTNFTHPLNYLVCLEEYYLKEQLSKCRKEVQDIFGYKDKASSLDRNLNSLKVNLAHYGGSEQWLRYQQADRKNLSAELIENADRGMELFKTQNPKPNEDPYNYGKPAWIWYNDIEWFSIISSMMLQYPNVYADISYILHTEEVKPLLYQVLNSNHKLASKILFGTDFFVVRNHKSEKELYSELLSFIGRYFMDGIARNNPDAFLKTR